MDTTTSPVTRTPLPDALTLGPVRLRVRDGARSLAFYRDVVGLTPLATADGIIRLGAGGRTLIELEEAPNAPARPRGTTGLFHVAILMPDRAALAVVLKRLIARGVRLGASDHIVSEALYLDDPDGNGIEIYRDRRRDEWFWQAGTIAMATEPLDLRNLLADAPADLPVDAPMPDGTVVGHVHLQVGDLALARRFYVERLGFDITTERYPGALFVSAGGYHHHLGLNVWHSQGRGGAPDGAIGLVSYTVVLPDSATVTKLRERLKADGLQTRDIADGFAVADPWGTTAHVVVG